jgi:hypothetical protein
MNNKVNDIMAYVVDQSISIFFVTETWITDLNNNTTAIIKSYGFKITHKIRTDSNKCMGGGVAIIYKDWLNLTQVVIKHGKSFESVSAKFKTKGKDSVFCSCIYRTGPVLNVFFEDLDDFLATIFIKFNKILICGDINLHLDNFKAPTTTKFTELISSYGLHQLLSCATQRSGHTLDVVITSNKIINESSLNVGLFDATLFPSCDHFPIVFKIQSDLATKATDGLKPISFRNTKKINTESFRSDLSTSLSVLNDNTIPFSEMITLYDGECLQVLDSHAPLLHKQIKDRPSAPWFDGEYKVLRIKRRKAEKQFIKSGRPEHKALYVELRESCNLLSATKKKQFYRDQFQKHNHSPKSLYQFVDHFMDKDKTLILPPNESLQQTVEDFNNYFQDKVDKIRSGFNGNQESDTEHNIPGCTLTTFEPTTVEEVKEILKDIEIKSSTNDPLPANIVKDNLDLLVPHLVTIVNLSLSSGSMEGAKLAHITPLVKNLGLDQAELKSYRPISNLSFVGKLIERVVLRRLNNHLESNNLNIPWQSGYKKNHSTETLLIRVVNDLLIASEENKATVVMLLDLSAAFDTVDHNVLIRILEKEIGITGNALKWFKSFISGRCQKVKIGTHESVEIIIRFGVPQGSVLGPVLFNLYIRSLYQSVQKLKFLIQGYADDHQIYNCYNKTSEYSMLVSEIPDCFRRVSEWMTNHYLQLNPTKTELIVFGSPAVLDSLSIHGVFLEGDICIRLSPVVKNLGFRLDSTLSFRTQVTKVKCSCFHKLRNIAKMKNFLTERQMRILIQSVILSAIDYCNSLYFGCHSSVINQLQTIQNRACRVIFGLKKRESVQQKLQELHWLKVKERIEFKFLLLIYKAVNGLAPAYLNELITFTNDSGCRRRSLHVVDPYNNRNRAFQTAAPALWNNLPSDIRRAESVTLFKIRLKTHLFKRSYDLP